MASAVVEESATQVFSKLMNVSSSYNLEQKLFPNLTFKDVIEIHGESGSGKTELLYHFIVRCLLPRRWQGMEGRVVFVDNDCRFDLFRLTTIFETRLKTLLPSEEIALLISERIKFLKVVRCHDSQQFLITLCSLENSLSLNETVVMVDGLTSFYWCDRMRMQSQQKKVLALYSKIYSVIKNISRNGKTPLFTTKRRIMNNGKKILSPICKNIVTWQIELTLEGSKPHKTIVSLSNVTNGSAYHCVIGKFGFDIMDQKEKFG